MAEQSRTEPEALMQTSREWTAAVAAGDIERALAYWTDDAIVLPPDQPAVVGKVAIREFVRQATSIPGFSITWEPELAMLSNDGDMAYMVERNKVTFNDPAGDLQTQHGKAVTVWRRQPDRAWRCVVDTWNNNPLERVFPTN
jgi:ketosteroid isomerase-like protein